MSFNNIYSKTEILLVLSALHTERHAALGRSAVTALNHGVSTFYVNAL